MKFSLRTSISAALCVLLAGCASSPVRDLLRSDVTYDDDYARAVAAIEAHDYATAEAFLVEVTAREPGHAAAWANLGMVLMRTASDSEATVALETAVSIDPELAPAFNQLGVLYRRAGRLADAEQAYRGALDADPAHASAHRNLGILYDLYLARPAEALHHYQRALELQGEQATLARWVADLERRVRVMEASNHDD